MCACLNKYLKKRYREQRAKNKDRLIHIKENAKNPLFILFYFQCGQLKNAWDFALSLAAVQENIRPICELYHLENAMATIIESMTNGVKSNFDQTFPSIVVLMNF